MTSRRSTLRSDTGAVRDATLTMARLGKPRRRVPQYAIEIERDGGFVIVDEYGELVEPTRCHSSWANAQDRIREMVADDEAAAQEGEDE